MRGVTGRWGRRTFLPVSTLLRSSATGLLSRFFFRFLSFSFSLCCLLFLSLLSSLLRLDFLLFCLCEERERDPDEAEDEDEEDLEEDRPLGEGECLRPLSSCRE